MEENLFLYEKGALVSARVVTDDLEQNFRAKVLKREIRDSKPFYYLHYIGWNERYDDWREESILSQIVPVRMGTRRSTSASNTTKNSKTRMATKKPANKRKREAESRLDDDSKNLRMTLTSGLNNILFQDARNVKAGKFIALPATPTISGIIDGYLKQNENLDADKKALLSDLCLLFNAMAGKHLFYPQERMQYREVLQKGDEPQSLCNIYGSIHLLRLFVKLPMILTTIPEMDPIGLELIKSVCNGLIEYIDKNARIFVGVYETYEEK